MIWLRYAIVQLVSAGAMLLGLFVLSIPCLTKAWEVSPVPSVKDGRQIDRWKFSLLNYVYGNPEDGVSGQQAVVWSNGAPMAYMASSGACWRAYCWSALRNSCDALKYRFAYAKGPLKTFTFGGWGLKLGWQQENGFNVPIFSVRKV